MIKIIGSKKNFFLIYTSLTYKCSDIVWYFTSYFNQNLEFNRIIIYIFSTNDVPVLCKNSSYNIC